MIVSADANGKADGTVVKIAELVKSKYPIIPITRLDGYKFNEQLLKLGKYILFDFCEYGANDWDRKETHLFGKNTDKFKYAFPGKEWDRFDEWVASNPPLVYFKRELLKKDSSANIIPIEYPSWAEESTRQGKQDFINRPIELFHCWGWSHESRRTFHGNVWQHAAKNGIYVVDNLNYIANSIKDIDNKRLWVTANVPHYARVNMDFIYSVLRNSILSLSLPGAGIKCFRHSEVSADSIMVMQEDPLAWSYEWIHGVNCIRVPIGDTMEDIMGINGSPEIGSIELALKRTDLWKIYLEGVNNCDKYRPENYIAKYIEPIIKKA